MPRLITDTVSIAARITHPETEVRCMTAQPSECRRILKTLQCGRFSRCPDVDGAPAVVFTESWGCVHCKNVIEWNATCAFAAENPHLVMRAPVTGYGLQPDAIGCGCSLHPSPGLGGIIGQP